MPRAEVLPGRSLAHLSKIPPELSDALLQRGEWSLCAMEHSRIRAIEFEAPGAPFHHLTLPLERVPLKISLQMDGRRRIGRNAPDTLTMIEAGAGGTAMWDGTFESACFYFTTAALGTALGFDLEEGAHAVRTQVELHSPRLSRLLHALRADAQAGQPHGALVGDAIFVALAAQLVLRGEHRHVPPRAGGEASRVRRAIEYIQANLTDRLNIEAISGAASTSPFYLNHAFRTVLGASIWQYVLRERARYAFALMRDTPLNLAEVAQLAGFETYASFISSTRREYGCTPGNLRRLSF